MSVPVTWGGIRPRERRWVARAKGWHQVCPYGPQGPPSRRNEPLLWGRPRMEPRVMGTGTMAQGLMRGSNIDIPASPCAARQRLAGANILPCQASASGV